MTTTPLHPAGRPATLPNPMELAEEEALLSFCLMAALADGVKNDAERAEFKRIVERLATPGLDTLKIYHDVLLKHATVERSAAALSSPETRQLAYEMAVCVCDADDTLSVAEQEFLAGLRRALGLDTARAAGFEEQACALVVASVPPPLPSAAATTSPAPPIEDSPAGRSGTADAMVLNYAILNGALELLPESLATMAIVPLQMKMVYRIGRRHGYELDRRHITELLGAAGLGLTSQVVEGYTRKLLGGLLGRVGAGGTLRQVGSQVAGSALTFATTYALGQMADRYYAGGRTLSGSQLRNLFQSVLERAQALHGQHARDIQARARGLNPARLLELVRGR